MRSAVSPTMAYCAPGPRCARLGTVQGSATFLGHGGAEAAPDGCCVGLCLRIPPAGAFLLPFKWPL